MKTQKVWLTLRSDVIKQARARAGKRGLSAYIDDALYWKLQHERIQDFLDEQDSKYGPVPDDVREEAEKRWLAGDREILRGRTRSEKVTS